jgi:hypothetical protein
MGKKLSKRYLLALGALGVALFFFTPLFPDEVIVLVLLGYSLLTGKRVV